MSALSNMVSESRQELKELKQMIETLNQKAEQLEDKFAYLQITTTNEP